MTPSSVVLCCSHLLLLLLSLSLDEEIKEEEVAREVKVPKQGGADLLSFFCPQGEEEGEDMTSMEYHQS